jgi:hypothetical protein
MHWLYKKLASSPWHCTRLLLLPVACCLPALAAAQAAPTATSDATNVYYRIPYSGTPTNVRLFLDTDSKALTGYSFGGIGGEYLIENGTLYRYSGTGGSSWAWTFVKSVSYSLANGVANVAVARAAIGSPSSLNLVSWVEFPKQISAKLNQVLSAPAPIATSDATNVYYRIPYSGTPTNVRLFLDTDRNLSTGYRFGGIGGEYLIENGTLYRYSGTGGSDWGWTFVKSLTYSLANGVANVTIARAAIGAPTSLDLVSWVEMPTQISAKTTQTVPIVLGTGTTSPTSPTTTTSPTSPTTTTTTTSPTSPTTTTSPTSPTTTTTTTSPTSPTTTTLPTC